MILGMQECFKYYRGGGWRVVCVMRKSGGKAFDDCVGVQACDGDKLVAALLPFDDCYGGLLNTQYPAEEVGQLPVGLTLLRRRGDFYLEDAAGKTDNLVPAGTRVDLNLKLPVNGIAAIST